MKRLITMLVFVILFGCLSLAMYKFIQYGKRIQHQVEKDFQPYGGKDLLSELYQDKNTPDDKK